MATNKRKKNSRESNNNNSRKNNKSEATKAETNEKDTSSTIEASAAPTDANTTSANVSETPKTDAVAESTESKESASIETTSDQSIIMQQGDSIEMAPSTKESKKPEAKKANKTTEAAPIPAPVVQKSGSGFATTMASFAFLLSMAAGGGIYYTLQQIQIEKNEAASTISALEAQLTAELQKSQAALRNEVSETQATIKSELNLTSSTIRSELDSKAAAIESLTKNIESTTSTKIAGAEERFTAAQAELGKANHSIKETQKRQQSLEVSIDGLYSRIGNTSRDWVIAEADYLLKIANHRLQLEQDVTTSIQALTLADNRINSLSDPALNEVRNVIAQELITLQTLPIPDQAGVSMQLTELQEKVDRLPLNARTQPTKQDQPEATAEGAMTVESWDALPGAILGVLEGLVAVNYNDKPIEPLLSPEQVKHLHENLKLKLEQARMVLLRGDQPLYQANIDLAINWTEKFFNTDEVATKKFIDTLAYLKNKQVVLKIPDISSSLRTLRKVSKRLEINAPGMETNASNGTAEATTNVAMN